MTVEWLLTRYYYCWLLLKEGLWVFATPELSLLEYFLT